MALPETFRQDHGDTQELLDGRAHARRIAFELARVGDQEALALESLEVVAEDAAVLPPRDVRLSERRRDPRGCERVGTRQHLRDRSVERARLLAPAPRHA